MSMAEFDGDNSMVDALKRAAESIADSLRLLSKGDTRKVTVDCLPADIHSVAECFVSVPASIHFGSKAIADGLGKVADALHDVAEAIRGASDPD